MRTLLYALAGGAVWYFFIRTPAPELPNEVRPGAEGDCPEGYAMTSADPASTRVEDLRCIKYK